MNFSAYWSESINMLRCGELKALFLDAMNIFRKSLILMTKYFWWLIALMAGQAYLTPLLKSPNTPTLMDSYNQLANMFSQITSQGLVAITIFSILLLFVALLLFLVFILIISPWLFLIFTTYLTVNPTTDTKNYAYYRNYLKMFWGFYVILMPACFIFSILYLTINSTIYYLLASLSIPCFLYADPSIFLFFSSNRKVIPSIKHGFSLAVNFLPLYIVLQIPLIAYYLFMALISHYEISTLYPSLKTPISLVLYFLSIFIVILASASISAAFYVKIKNKYPELFPQKD